MEQLNSLNYLNVVPLRIHHVDQSISNFFIFSFIIRQVLFE